ncbi:LPS translocon maturation chaperone LptM [Salaquimonas pukyongi]|uniref:LPS translocon maturation chaperone LptM n=1 Tax=Salaquimonas pukyongi TaxID=2712698 RepID=UPI001966E634|nr:lipoprotein [Salaquimonas pukyongi]
MMCGNGYNRLLAVVLLAGLVAVSACGRKGPLEPPPGSVSPSTSSGTASEPAAEDNRIILDALI